MGKGSASVDAQQSKGHTEQETNQASTGTGAYSKEATFDPRADTLLGSLSNYGNTTLNSDSSQPNPYAQQVVDTQDRLAQQDFQKRLAGVKSSGYGGGIGSDLINQGMFTSDFTNRQHASDAQTLLNAFQSDQGNKQAVSNQVLQLLSLLRGEKGVNQQAANTDTSSVGHTANQTIKEGTSVSGSF